MTHAEPWLHPVIKLGTLAGLRLGEIISLKWDQIDKERGVLRIPPASKGHKWREVPITPDLWPFLRAITPFVGKKGRSPFVLVDQEKEKPYPEHRIQAAYARAIRDANIANQAAAMAAGTKVAVVIEDLIFHDLRRTFASRLAQRGVSLQTIAELLGHSAMYVTLRYAWLQPENLRAAVAVLSSGGVAKNLPSEEAGHTAPAATHA
jgi:integrase